MIRDELARIIGAVPEHAGYVTVPRKFLVKLYAEMSQPATDEPQVTDERLVLLEPHLTRIEYRMLSKLFEERRIVSPGALMVASGAATLGSLWVHKNRLCRKLAELCPSWTINTIRGKGYQMAETKVV